MLVRRAPGARRRRESMADVVFVVLTVLVFALLAACAKAAEKL
ncbi:MAG TPA: hypothetical protein VFU35_14395 [Jatrophihabitans sp.]|nr:hypothetical protein [Jatrophihabitans sp.]